MSALGGLGVNPSVIFLIIGGVAVLVAIGLIAVGYTRRHQGDPLTDRLAQFGAQQELTENLEDIEMSIPFRERVLLPLMQSIADFTIQFTPKQTLEKTHHMIELAGNPSGLTPSILWVMRIGAMIGLGVMLNVVMVISGQPSLYVILALVGGGVFGFMMPQLWLQSKISRRQEGIIRALPDALDLMTICVDAGLGFDQAMTKVNEKWDNELALAFGRVIKEIQLGSTRREAMRHMSDSMDVADVTSFVGAIIQADQLGVSIAKVLRIQADQMRIKRRQRAQEKAQQAPVKMMIPMVALIFPSIWFVLLGPAGVQLYKVFSSGGFGGVF